MMARLRTEARPSAPDARATLALAAAIHRRFGLVLQPGLHSRLLRAAAELIEAGVSANLAEAIARLEGDPADSPVVRALCRAASVTETFFFRDRPQLDALVRAATIHLLAAKRAAGSRTLRVWSVACATGEEAYSLAHLFLEAAPDFKLEVLGTDMNDVALEVARKGVYGRRAFRGTDPESLTSLLRPVPGGFQVLPEVRERVSFRELNLVRDSFPPLGRDLRPFDVVVCRNVLIYVDPVALPEVVRKLLRSSAPQSILALSPAEYPAREFASGYQDLGRAVMLRTRTSFEAASSPMPTGAAKSPPRDPPRVVPEKSTAALVAHAAPRPNRNEPAAPHAGEAWDVRLVRWRSLADRGGRDAAERELDVLFAQTPDSPWLYLIRGQLALGTGDAATALRAFRAALFLEPGLAAAQLGTAQCLMKEGRSADAERHFGKVLAQLEGEAADAKVPGLDLTVETVRRLAGPG